MGIYLVVNALVPRYKMGMTLVQLLTSDYKRLLNKPYENEITLKWQNPPLKSC